MSYKKVSRIFITICNIHFSKKTTTKCLKSFRGDEFKVFVKVFQTDLLEMIQKLILCLMGG